MITVRVKRIHESSYTNVNTRQLEPITMIDTDDGSLLSTYATMNKDGSVTVSDQTIRVGDTIVITDAGFASEFVRKA